MAVHASDANLLKKMISNASLSLERRRRIGLSGADESTIKVVETEFYALQNAERHHTELYELVENGTPVLRRGQEFFLAIRFDRPYNEETDLIRLVFNLGPTPNPSKGTSVVLPVKKKNGTHSRVNKYWTVDLDTVQEETIVMEVYIPYTAPIGSWLCSIFTSDATVAGSLVEYKCSEYIYILFNPWCEDDGVYIKNENERDEYVLNDIGKVWKGTDKMPEGYRWVYGQFDEVVLPVIMILLERSDIEHFDRWMPVKITRAIAAIVNSEDEDGLIQGEWNDFSDGTSPFVWTGTVAIMEEFLNNGCLPVKYGQCWVFAAAITTICRALGIPCRPVTNYHSAHDTNSSLTIDVHYDKQGEKLEEFNSDSCWNFHVWNDVWLTRPDLPPGYGGWQAIDGTPQESSEDTYRCGPASVEAVRRGDVGLNYDVKFVYTEVNGDICSFQLDEEKMDFCLVNINKDYIGTKIVTKKIGLLLEENDNSDMEIITNLYKYTDATAERLALYNAIRSVPLAQKIYNVSSNIPEDVAFSLVDIEKIHLGEPFRIIVKAQNESDEVRTILISMSANAVLYTGVNIHLIKRSQTTITLNPRQGERLSILIKPEDYISKLADQSIIKMSAIANVEETKQTWLADDDFVVIKPSFDITITGAPSVDGIFEAVFSFQNPLPFVLTNCTINVQMIGAKERPDIIKWRDVNPKEIIKYSCSFSPKTAGEKTILATFTSKQLPGIVGSKTVLVV